MIKYKVHTKNKVKLSEYDPSDRSFFSGTKEEGRQELLKLNRRLEILQELLYAEHKHKVLIVLQAMDTGGKDGVIRNVFDGVNPQGVKVASFKVPTTLELDHDYLWRIHLHTPGRGEIVIFNRSHYEDVLVVRVHNLVENAIWSKRYDHINAFEKMLHEEGTTILKFFLHISYEEQRKRFLDRINEPEKNWKFNPGDIEERELWDDYSEAYEEALSKTSTSWAPWFIIPANRKWYRNLAVSTILVDALDGLKMKFPAPKENLNIYRSELEFKGAPEPVVETNS
jgi:PPK2 family polyphosphate:nucleotide phosphotransferase